MSGRSGSSRGTAGRDLLALLLAVSVVQFLPSYRALAGEGSLLADNLFWPYVALAVLGDYVVAGDRVAGYRLAACSAGVGVAAVAYVAAPSLEKLLAGSLLGLGATYYALETLVDGSSPVVTSR